MQVDRVTKSGTAAAFRAGARSVRARLAMWVAVSIGGCQTYEPLPLEPSREWAVLLERGRESASAASDRVADRRSEKPEWFPLSAAVDTDDGISLAEANAIALFYNPRILRARHEASVAGAQLLQAGLLENPGLSLGPRFSTGGSDVIFPASLSWELPLWGIRGARRNVADSRAKKVALDLQAAELEVLVEVRHHYERLWKVAQELDALEALQRTSGVIQEWVARLDRAGEVDATTAWLASWETHRVATLRLEKRAERRRVRNELCGLLGLLPTAAVEMRVTGRVTDLDLPAPSLQTLRRHPRVRAAEESYETAEAALRLEVAQQYPAVRLGPEFEDDAGHSSIGFGLGFELPLFDRNPGGVAAATARRDAARDHYRSVLLALCHEETEARAAAANANALLELLRGGPSRRAQQVFRALAARLELGVSSVSEVLAAQRALTEARLEEIRLQTLVAQSVFSAAVAGGAALKPPSETAPEERSP